MSLWQVRPIFFFYFLHTFLSLSLIGPACHCGRSRLFTPPPLPLPSSSYPLLLSYRPGLSLWQVPLIYSPLFSNLSTSSTSPPLFSPIGPACHCGRSRLTLSTLLLKTNILFAIQIYPNPHRSSQIPTSLHHLQNLHRLSQIFTDPHRTSDHTAFLLLKTSTLFTPQIYPNPHRSLQTSNTFKTSTDRHRSPQILTEPLTYTAFKAFRAHKAHKSH